jgi:hypothetical protein
VGLQRLNRLARNKPRKELRMMNRLPPMIDGKRRAQTPSKGKNSCVRVRLAWNGKRMELALRRRKQMMIGRFVSDGVMRLIVVPPAESTPIPASAPTTLQVASAAADVLADLSPIGNVRRTQLTDERGEAERAEWSLLNEAEMSRELASAGADSVTPIERARPNSRYDDYYDSDGRLRRRTRSPRWGRQ